MVFAITINPIIKSDVCTFKFTDAIQKIIRKKQEKRLENTKKFTFDFVVFLFFLKYIYNLTSAESFI